MIVQIAVLIIFFTSNLFISNMLGPEEVTPYNIANKLFSVLTMGFTIVLTPFWSAITDAYTRNEYEWIKTTVAKLRLFWVGICVIGIIIASLSPFLYKFWIGSEVEVPFTLSVLCLIYALIQNWNNIYAYSINGIGKLNVSILCAIFSAVIYIPLTLILGKHFGLNGIVASLCISLSISSIILPIQYNKLVNNSATGIWNK